MRTRKEPNSQFAVVLEKIIYISLGIVMLILPFPRGLFFEKEIMPVELAIYSIFILWTIYKILNKDKLRLNSYMILGMCALTVAYMLPAFLGYAVNKSDAVNYVMRYTSYLFVFIIVSDMTKDMMHLKIWLCFIAISGITAIILGIDSMAGGQIGIKLGFSDIGLNQYNRLNGVLQYANTSGMYFGMIFFVLAAISTISEFKITKIICSGLMFLSITTLIFTLSRGAIIIMPFVYLLLIIFITEKDKKIEFILSTVAPIIVSFVLYQPMQNCLNLQSKIWIFAVLGVLVSTIATFLLLLLTQTLERISQKTYNAVFIAVIALTVLTIVVVWITGIYKNIIPQELLDRFLSSQGSSGRTDFYRDGLKVLKKYWLFGAGGGAWNALYRAYQSYDYSSTEAHNLLLQVWIETGIIGIASLVSVILAALKRYYDSKKKNLNTTASVLLLAIAIYAISHSMIDFDFSYFSIPIIVFSILGSLDGISPSSEKDTSLKKFKFPAWTASIVAVSFAAISTCFIVARTYATQATEIVRSYQDENGSLEADVLLNASQKLQKATKLNPWNVDFYVMEKKVDADMQLDLDKIYNLYEQIVPDDNEELNLHYAAIQKAVKLNSKNPIVNIMAAQFMLNKAGDIETGLEYMDNGLKYNPMAFGRYEETANAYYEAGRYFAESGDMESAKKYLQRVLKLEDDMESINKIALKPVVMSENTKSYIAQAQKILENL